MLRTWPHLLAEWSMFVPLSLWPWYDLFLRILGSNRPQGLDILSWWLWKSTLIAMVELPSLLSHPYLPPTTQQ